MQRTTLAVAVSLDRI